MQEAFSQGLLWKIDTAGNAVAPSYLLGTLTSTEPPGACASSSAWESALPGESSSRRRPQYQSKNA